MPDWTEDLALSTSRRGLLAARRRGAARRDRGRRRSRRSSTRARPTATTSAATSTRPTRARTRPACRASTRAACRCARRTASASTTPGGWSTREGRPVDERGRLLSDPDGRPLPPAPRTPLCDQVAERYGFSTWTDGAWYRCCGGHVRKLVDCCTTNRRRINGDGALTGYCYKGRKVFCVMYFDTKVPC